MLFLRDGSLSYYFITMAIDLAPFQGWSLWFDVGGLVCCTPIPLAPSKKIYMNSGDLPAHSPARLSDTVPIRVSYCPLGYRNFPESRKHDLRACAPRRSFRIGGKCHFHISDGARRHIRVNSLCF